MAVATSTAVALALAAAAAGASYYNTRQTAKKQDQALAAGIRAKTKKQSEADAKIAQQLEQLKGSNPDAERQSALQQYGEALRGTDQQAAAGQALSGLSAEYDAATSANESKSKQYLSGLTDILSRLDAPMMQRQREGFGMQGLGRDLSVIGREAQGIDWLANMRAQGVRRNPYIDALAAGLNAYAGGVGAGGAGASTAATTAGGIGAGAARFGAGFGG